jgi:hypothetical protein
MFGQGQFCHGRGVRALVAVTVVGLTLIVCGQAVAAPPTVTITYSPPSDTNQTNVTFQFTASDGSTSFIYSLDRGAAHSSGPTLLLQDLTAGPHTLSVAVSGGNLPNPATSYSWTEELSAPTVTITSGPPMNTYQTSATFTFTSSDPNATFLCRDPNALSQPGTPCTSPVTYTGLSPGPGVQNFYVVAEDQAGNLSDQQSYEWTIGTPPTTTIAMRTGDIIQGGLPTVATSTVMLVLIDSSVGYIADPGPSDPSPSFVCIVDNARAEPCTTPFTISGLSNGTHTVLASAYDSAGNLGPESAPFTFYVEAGPVPAPTASLGPDPNPPTNTPPPLRPPGFARVHRKAPARGKPGSHSRSADIANALASLRRNHGGQPRHQRPIRPLSASLVPALLTSLYAQLNLAGGGTNLDHYLVTDEVPGSVLDVSPTNSHPPSVEPVPAGTTSIDVPLYGGVNCFQIVAVDTFNHTSPPTQVCANRIINADWSFTDGIGTGFGGDTGIPELGTLVSDPTGGYFEGQYQALGTYPVITGIGPDTSPFADSSIPITAIYVVATTCPTCGTVRVALAGLVDSHNISNPSPPWYLTHFFGPGDASKSVLLDTESATTHHGVVFEIADPGRSDNGYMFMSAANGQPEIEGVGIVEPAYAGPVLATDCGGNCKTLPAP